MGCAFFSSGRGGNGASGDHSEISMMPGFGDLLNSRPNRKYQLV
jgi:hypothetical protein